MSEIILISADFPEVRLHRALASGSVFLLLERDLVLGDLHQVGLTGLDGRRDSGEACTSVELVGRERGAAFHFFTQIHAVTVGVLGCCDTVGTKQHLCTRVLRATARF